MERPWLILRRVLDVHPPGDMHANAEEHAAAAGEAEADAQAQEQQNAGVVAAPEEHQAMGAAGAGGPDFTVTVAPPPMVSSLLTGPGAHPNPARPDMYPYIIATGSFCILVHFAVAPSYGTNFGQRPSHSNLVVVRHFLMDDADGGQIVAGAVHVPDRPYDEYNAMPALGNIQSVGLVCDQATFHYQIAELILTTGNPQAVVVYMKSDTGVWAGNYFVNPLWAVDRRRDWVPHGTVTINSTVLWYDLSWGIISCNLAQHHLQQMLIFHRLPPGCILCAEAGVLDLHYRRCIAVSDNLVRFVEIIHAIPNQASTVNMWYRDVEDDPWRWQTNYKERFDHIWDDHSYEHTGLPRKIPMLVGVSPVNSNVVYFSLEQRLFGVNVPEHTVVHCEDYQPLNLPEPPDEPPDMPGPPLDEPATGRYLITWNLDLHGAPNVGHHPDEASDHGDSSASGPLDEGDIDYETLSD